MSLVAPGESTTIFVQLYDRATNQYPQAKLYDPDGNLVTTQNLTHLANGYYYVKYTPDGTYEYLSGNIIIYSNSGHTTVNEGYDTEPVEITVKRFSTPMPMGGRGTTIVGAGAEDIEKLKKWLEEQFNIIDERLSQVENKKIEFPKIEIPKPNFKLDRDLILSEFKKIIDKLPKQDENILRHIADEIKKLPKEIPPTQVDFTEIINLIKTLDIPQDKSEEIIKAIKEIPPPLPAKDIDLTPVLDKFEELPIGEQTELLQNIQKNMPDRKKLKDFLMMMENHNAERTMILVDKMDKLIPGLKAEYYRQSREMDNKLRLNNLLNESFA